MHRMARIGLHNHVQFRIIQLGVSEDEVTLEASFKEDLDADSLDLFELVMALEEEYDVEIPSDDLAELNTVGDVINYLKDKGVED